MGDREELQALRRLAELEAKAGGAALPQNATPVTGTEQVGDDGGMLNYVPGVPLGEAALGMASGISGKVLGGYAALVGGALPGPEGQASRFAENVSSALTYAPRTRVAQKMLQAAELPAIPIQKAAEAVGERGAEVSPVLGAIGKTSVEALPLLLGLRATPASVAKSPNVPGLSKVPPLGLKAKTPLTAPQQKVAAARDAGFVMTPEEMGAGAVPRTAASLAGEPRLAKLTSKKNVATATAKAKAELGIRPDAPLDLDTLTLIRKQEGAAYEAARKAGTVQMDAKYIADIDALGAKYRSAAKDFPGLAKPEVGKVIAALKKEDPAIAAARAQGIKLPAQLQKGATFEANSAVDLIGQLRESADAAFRGGMHGGPNPGLAKVMRGGAEALEAQLERHLAAAGQPEVLQAFRAARTRIAKTYAVEKALVGDQVAPQALGRQVTKGRPLTGGLKETGEFGRQFERSSQKPSNMPTGPTIHDLGISLLSLLHGDLRGIVPVALGAISRPAARSALASRPAQFLMDPRTNLSGPALQAVGASSALPPPRNENR